MNFSGYEQMYRLTVIYLLTLTYILFIVTFECTVVHFFCSDIDQSSNLIRVGF